MYCTQCEAMGFRRITYYPDRPDNMAVFERVRLEADKADYPILLANGNLIESGDLDADTSDQILALLQRLNEQLGAISLEAVASDAAEPMYFI